MTAGAPTESAGKKEMKQYQHVATMCNINTSNHFCVFFVWCLFVCFVCLFDVFACLFDMFF